jgi:hypothetical protein
MERTLLTILTVGFEISIWNSLPVILALRLEPSRISKSPSVGGIGFCLPNLHSICDWALDWLRRPGEYKLPIA